MLANKGRLVCRLFPGQQRNMGSGGVHTADIVISGETTFLTSSKVA